MEEFEYSLLLASCLSMAVFAAWIYGAWKSVWERKRALVLAIGLTFVFFSVWDYLAILRKHWWFNDRYVTGLRVVNVPVEELVFFVVIPLACLLTWEILCKVLRHKR